MKRIVSVAIMSAALMVGGLAGTAPGPASADSPRAAESLPAVNVTLPLKEGSVRLAVVGDTGSGAEAQKEVANLMLRYREAFPFGFVLMLGDNLYGSEDAEDYREKFELVYKRLTDAEVKFYAALGNHDEVNQRNYEPFNMNGKEYYRFKVGDVAFYALNSNYMDKKQVEWLEDELSKDRSEWKVCFFHHPPYSSGKQHGSDRELREVVEPIFVKHGVNLVLAGHEHFYERLKPQKGIYYFISGAAGKLREGGIKRGSELTAKAFDGDLSFMLIEIADHELHFQVISRAGKTVDSGMLEHQSRAKVGAPAPA